MRYRLLTVAGLAVAAWVLPYGLNLYAVHVVNVAVIFGLLAVGLGLAMGVAGQVNLAQVAFFGVGAYACAILTTTYGFGFWGAAVVAVFVALGSSLLVGVPALRVQSHYLGIVTLGLALAFTNWVTNAALSGGAEGINNLPAPPFPGLDLSNEYLFYYVELVVFALGLAFALFVVHSPLGRRMRAMRDDTLAAGATGVEIPQLRLVAFALAGLYGGVAGALYAGLIRYVAPESFSIANMFLLLAMVIIGGRQSIVGCVVGALGLTFVRELLVDFSAYAQLAYGAVVVLVVVFAPAGLAGVPAQLRARLRRDTGTRASLRPFLPPDAVDTATDGAPALEIREVSKNFRGLNALVEVSVTVAPGEIRGIVGPNGSGKTTLFNVVSGFYVPSAGRVLVRGTDVTGRPPYRMSHLGVARTFQNLRLFPTLSVRENVLVALDRTRTRWIWRYAVLPWNVRRHDRTLHARADELLVRFGLAEFAGATPRALPYGIQRRVEIARAMGCAPDVLLLDEPAAGLNGDEVRQLGEIVRALRAAGTTVVVIEHNMGLVMSLCDRVTVLAGGRVIAEGTPAEVATRPEVVEAYLGDTDVLEGPAVPEVVN
jgi:branched-chain amino acid transport system permease protein